METLKHTAKAWVAAGVTFLSAVIALKFGFEIPLEWQSFIVIGLMSVLNGGLTWLVPNK